MSKAPSGVAEEAPTSAPNWREFYESHWSFVFSASRRLGGPAIDAEDVLQEVFIVAHRRFAEFRQESSVRTWLYGITFNVIRDQRRSWYRRRRLADAFAWIIRKPQETPESRAQITSEARRLYRLLDKIPESEREVFLLREVEALSIEETAEVLQLTVAVVRSRHASARKRFVALAAIDKGGGDER